MFFSFLNVFLALQIVEDHLVNMVDSSRETVKVVSNLQHQQAHAVQSVVLNQLIQNDDGSYSFVQESQVEDREQQQESLNTSSNGMLAALLESNAKILGRLDHLIDLHEKTLAAVRSSQSSNNTAIAADILNTPVFNLIDTTDDLEEFESKLSNKEFYNSMVSFWS